MKRTLIYIAACTALAARADGGQENTSVWRIAGAVMTAAGGVKAIIDIYDWIMNRWVRPPQDWKAGDVWLCNRCSFPKPGGMSTPDDDATATDYISEQFPGRRWSQGQQLAVCDGVNCFIFEFDGTQWRGKGTSFKDPGVGHANTTPVPRYAPSSGSTGSIPSGLTPGWSPQAYIPNFEGPLKTGSLTMNWTGIQKRD